MTWHLGVGGTPGPAAQHSDHNRTKRFPNRNNSNSLRRQSQTSLACSREPDERTAASLAMSENDCNFFEIIAVVC